MIGLDGSAALALGSAALWGGGDFSGGMGVGAAGGKTGGALRVVLLSHVSSFAVLALIVAMRHDALPHGALLGWSLLAGLCGGVSLTCFYMALSRGAMGASAAVSGVLAAAIPALVSAALEGAPAVLRVLGFGLAAVAIWMIAAGPKQPTGPKGHRVTMGLAVTAGIGFGVYFVALRMANPLGVFVPMATARVGSIVTCTLTLAWLRLRGRERTDNGGWTLTRKAVLWALAAGTLDTTGNLMFIAATRAGRLDVAAVLASLYPASTILLAGWLLKERLSRRQWMGMAVALAAVVMISV